MISIEELKCETKVCNQAIIDRGWAEIKDPGIIAEIALASGQVGTTIGILHRTSPNKDSAKWEKTNCAYLLEANWEQFDLLLIIII